MWQPPFRSQRAADQPFLQYFSVDGQGGGGINMGVDGAAAQKIFRVEVPAGASSYSIARVMFHLQDTGAFDANKLGNGIDLSGGTGIGIIYESAEWGNVDLLGGQKIKQNSHFGRIAYDVQVHSWGIGDEVLLSRWTFTKWIRAKGDGPVECPIKLVGTDHLKITIDDNLTGLVAFNALCEGSVE